MQRASILIGQRFNRLTVIRDLEIRKHGAQYFLCECECGNTTEVSKYSLLKGDVKACGCLIKQGVRKDTNRDKALKRKLYRNRILYRTKNKQFSGTPISFETFCKLIALPCHYCGASASLQYSEANKKGTLEPISNTVVYHNGIDRLDNSKGYTDGNVAPCCPTCNLAKRGMSCEQFKAWIARAYRHLN